MHNSAEQQKGTLTISCFLQILIHSIIMLGSLYMLLGKNFIEAQINIGLLHFKFGMDYLTIFFYLLISILGLFVGIYSYGYLKEYQKVKHFNVFLILYNLFTISLYFVVSSKDIIGFLLFWELMSVTSYFLVIFEGHKEEILKSGLMYFVMTHIGTVFIMLAFFMLYKNTGSFYFDDFYGFKSNQMTTTIILLLTFIGFGTKAGMFPLHVWLPKAHPAAPTNVSSLMSGVMIKMGIYGIIRFCFDIPQTYVLSFGYVLLSIGVLSAVIGITHALIQSDMKIFLAYSSIENIGIIILALGVSYICNALNLSAIGGIAFTAALFHTFNHGIFKSMLFMGAGNVLHSTGTRNIEEMGGLIKRLPKTSCFFLVGALSACALPPFNGFIGEWFIYKSIIQASFQLNNILFSTPIVISGIALAFTGALAAYGFVKVFGIAFLGLPRSKQVNTAVEVPKSMTLPMGCLASLCVVLGIYPNLLMDLVSKISTSASLKSPVSYNSNVIIVSNTRLSMTLVVTVAIFITLSTMFFIKYKNKNALPKIYETWDCGYDGLNSRMQFSGQGYIKSFNKLLSGTFVVNKTVEYTKGYLNFDGIKFDINISDNVEKSIYSPIKQLVKVISLKAQKLQHGFIQSYLAYVFITLILLMIIYL